MKKENLNHAEMLSVLTNELANQPDQSLDKLRLYSCSTVGYMFRLYQSEHTKYVAVRSTGLHLHDSIGDVIKYAPNNNTGKVFEIKCQNQIYSIEEVEI